MTRVISPASAALPDELQHILDTDPEARGRWQALSAARQRMIREEILAARSPAARERRARKALEPRVPTQPAPAVDLPDKHTPVRVRITGRALPGTSCGPYAEVSVGMVPGAGCHPETMFAGDSPEVHWEARVEVRGVEGRAAFRGPAVNGPPHERFIYLTWMGRLGGAAPAMFRRAKLRLDTIPADVLTSAVASGVLLGEVGLTDTSGMPLCASVKPPVIVWRAGPPAPQP